MIIDAHVHIHPDQDGLGGKHDARLEFLLQNLAESAVDKAILLPIAADTPYLKRIENSFVAECCQKYPDKLIGFASIHPFEGKDPCERLACEVAEYGLQGLKLHPRYQGFSADDERIVPLIETAAALNLPIAIDALLWKPTPLREQLPLNIDILCKRVPHAKVIICHAGGFHFLDALAVAIANDNVYLDLSVSLNYFHGTPFEEQFIFVLKQAGARRIIYGSDHPENPLKETYLKSRGVLEKHGFSEAELAQIFGGTILSLLPGIHS